VSHIEGIDPTGRKILDLWRKRHGEQVAALETTGRLAARLLEAQGEVGRSLIEVKRRLEKADPLDPHPTMLERIDYFKLIESQAWEEVAKRIPAP